MNALDDRMDPCARFAGSLSPYVDGELDPAHAIDMEQHVVECTLCTERVALIRAMRFSLKQATRCQVPTMLAARVCASMVREKARARMQDVAIENDRSPKLIRFRYAVALAAAAGIVFAMGVSRYNGQRSAHTGFAASASTDVASSSVDIDTLLEELIALHARPLPPDITNPEELQRFDPLLGVQVRRPPFHPFNASFRGARVHAVSDRGVLLQLQYVVPNDKRLTMYVFNPRVVPIHGTRLEQRVVRHRAILMGRLRGYSVAAAEQSGVGYAFASDLDTDESEKLVLAALQQQ